MRAGLVVIAALLALAGSTPDQPLSTPDQPLTTPDQPLTTLDRPLVRTALGILKGAWQTSNKRNRYAAFTGIPYAKPPVGALRFQAPQPMGPWLGEWDAGLDAPGCMAYSHLIGANDTIRIKGQEDCLYLNVYTPRVPKIGQDADTPLDVIVYIHGGAFTYGDSTYYGAQLIMDRDVVFVTLHYRLGPLGFLSLGDSSQPGNNGLRDQVAALQWVQNNIASFGGNPASVTLTGGSAGGASVQYHYLSPLSRGLFSRGISFSGTALCRWALSEHARSKSLQLASSLGCPTKGDSQQVIECLRQRPAKRIVEQVGQFQVWQYSPFSPFGPVVEPPGIDSPFLPDWPVRMLQRGEAARVPWVTGVTSAEGLYPAGAFVADEVELALLERDFQRLLPHLLDFNFTVEASRSSDVVDAIRHEYFGEKPVGSATVPELVKMIGDRLFLVDAQRAAEMQAKFSPVYFYQFDYRGKHSLSDIMSNTERDFGVSHTDDITYFAYMDIVKTPRSGVEKKVEEMMLDFWTSYAKDGVPRSSGVTWTPVTPGGDLEMLHIDRATPAMKNVSDLGNAAFWESLPLLEAPQSLTHHNTTEEEFY